MNLESPPPAPAIDPPAAAVESPDPPSAPPRTDRPSDAETPRLPPPEDDAAGDVPRPAPSSPVPSMVGLKIVLSLRSGKGSGQRALLAIGAEGNDPIYQAADVADLSAALDLVPALVVSALARWRDAPRYPTTRKPSPPKPARPTPHPTPTPSTPPAATTTPPATAPDSPSNSPHPGANPKPTQTSQLTLFG